MEKPYGNADPKLAEYVRGLYAPEDEILEEIRTRSVATGLPEIQVAALDALHLEVIARSAAARRAVEIGTLGGYSGVALLRGMGPEGLLDTFEIEPRHAEVARESFRRAGLSSRVRLHVGPALEGLAAIESEGPFDLVFIDADKERYPDYLDWAADHLRRGGIVLADNAFLFGELVGSAPPSRLKTIEAMNRFHDRLARSGRFRATVLPTGEGLGFGVKV